jgi:hypothetical protein
MRHRCDLRPAIRPTAGQPRQDVRPDYRDRNAQVLQEVVHRLDRAFAACFRRVQAGEQPGYPRLQGTDRSSSVSSPQVGEHGGAALDGEVLSLSKIGRMRIRLHRPIEGTPKTPRPQDPKTPRLPPSAQRLMGGTLASRVPTYPPSRCP